ncbi:YggT family protein [Clostridium sp. Marseille-Q2269]|uniref:YggT family protein n=1 Tax=Clostridium sp. Marseille-Q2269 TaxID=2942205 RepID=UPI002073B08E|nr:YggT family protein [Clostridium sp. Marseille-Q2269]
MVSNTIITAISLLFRLLEGAILIDVVLSWVAPGKQDPFTNFIHSLTNPLMKPARNFQNKIAPNLMIDFSPIFALVLLDIIRNLVFYILRFL